jgi:hypothetical protein
MIEQSRSKATQFGSVFQIHLFKMRAKFPPTRTSPSYLPICNSWLCVKVETNVRRGNKANSTGVQRLAVLDMMFPQEDATGQMSTWTGRSTVTAASVCAVRQTLRRWSPYSAIASRLRTVGPTQVTNPIGKKGSNANLPLASHCIPYINSIHVHWIVSVLNTSECHKILWGILSGWHVRLKDYRHLWAEYLDIVGSSTSHNLRATASCFGDSFGCFTLCLW